MSAKAGALPIQEIRDLIGGSSIVNAREECLNPASLDLSLSDEVYRVEGIFQPRPGEQVRDLIKEMRLFRHDLRSPLERSVVYVARFNEAFNLPTGVYGYCNPKSSTGRNDLHVRTLADGVPRYDAVTPRGYGGELWVAIVPKSIPVLLREGDRLSQVRFFTQDTRFDELELEMALERDKLLWTPEGDPIAYQDLQISDRDGSVILTIDLSGWDYLGEKNIVGMTPRKGRNKVLDFSRQDHDLWEYFEPLRLCNGMLPIGEGGFAILSGRQCVRVPPHLACEMAPMDERSGDFRAHYAGFIDPGWGYEDGSGKGRQLTLELRAFEDIILRPGQAIAKIKFERMRQIPLVSYDAVRTSHYCEQVGPRPSKHFKYAA